MYSVFVGRYNHPAESKKDQKKLEELGINAYLFHLDNIYSLKTYSYSSEEKAARMETLLKIKHFRNVFIK